MLLLCLPLVMSCRQTSFPRYRELAMVDCQFQNNGYLHLHIQKREGRASLISGLSPSPHPDHSKELRNGRESEGRLLPAANGDTVIEFFLLNDRFGNRADEVLVMVLAEDGRSKLQARRGSARPRPLDFGTCTTGLPDQTAS